MPKLVENPAEIEKFMKEKQQNEVDLSDALLKAFNSKPLIDELRAIVGVGLSQLITLHEMTRDLTTVVNKAMADVMREELKINMQVLTALGKTPKGAKPMKIELPAALPSIQDQLHTLDAVQCSDVIRLYGSMCEGLAKKLGKDGHYQAFMRFSGKDAQKEYDAWQKSPTGKAFIEAVEESFKNEVKGQEKVKDVLQKWKDLDALRDGLKYRDVAQKDPTVWDKGALAYGRHRVRMSKLDKDGHIVGQLVFGEIEARLAEERKGGSTIWHLKDTSTIGLMDHVFGLVHASDISGTTVDSTFFLEKMFLTSSVISKDPVFWALPLATIVAGNHHSTIEVGIPLSTMKKIDYVCGLYTTLAPKGATLGASAIQAALAKAEDDARNRLMLVFYSAKQKPAGAYVFADNELAAWKKLADARTLHATFGELMKSMSEKGWPKKAEIEALMKRHGLTK